MRQSSPLHIQDWQHRLQVLWAWRKWKLVNTSDRDDGATYRAVLDGCAITIRALCDILGVKCDFRNKSPCNGPERTIELLDCCKQGRDQMEALKSEDQSCLLEVLYLANRAIAHARDGDLDHKVSSIDDLCGQYGYRLVANQGVRVAGTERSRPRFPDSDYMHLAVLEASTSSEKPADAPAVKGAGILMRG